MLLDHGADPAAVNTEHFSALDLAGNQKLPLSAARLQQALAAKAAAPGPQPQPELEPEPETTPKQPTQALSADAQLIVVACAANPEKSSKNKLLAFLKAEHGLKLKESKAAAAAAAPTGRPARRTRRAGGELLLHRTKNECTSFHSSSLPSSFRPASTLARIFAKSSSICAVSSMSSGGALSNGSLSTCPCTCT